MKRTIIAVLGLIAVAAIAYSQLGVEPAPQYDLIITNGVVYDGSGGEGRRVDVAIDEDRIAAVGDLSLASAEAYVDADGKAVAPGFINVLSWAVESLIEDGNGESDIRQGVTTEVFGEGVSWGPVKPEMKAYAEARQGDIKYPIEWTTLGGYLEFLENKGVSPNVASFYGSHHSPRFRSWL